MIRRNRGFKLTRKIIRVFKLINRKRTRSGKYQQLGTQTKQKNRAIAKLCEWGTWIRDGLFNSGNRGYIRVTHDPKRVQVPKGYLVAYVGEGENTRCVLVPVLFLNHPLFLKLLKETEEVFGFDHPGPITIPCPISEFENVKTEIVAGEKCRQWRRTDGYVSRVKCSSF